MNLFTKIIIAIIGIIVALVGTFDKNLAPYSVAFLVTMLIIVFFIQLYFECIGKE